MDSGCSGYISIRIAKEPPMTCFTRDCTVSLVHVNAHEDPSEIALLSELAMVEVLAKGSSADPMKLPYFATHEAVQIRK